MYIGKIEKGAKIRTNNEERGWRSVVAVESIEIQQDEVDCVRDLENGLRYNQSIFPVSRKSIEEVENPSDDPRIFVDTDMIDQIKVYNKAQDLMLRLQVA